jgi:cytochrome c553
MKKILKWSLISITGIIVVLLLAAFSLTIKFENQIKKKVEITPASINIPTDSSSIERGLVLSVGCRNCHGVDLSGTYFFDDPTIGKLASSNLTRAKGSPTEQYTDIDWVRALRHGVGKNGKRLFVMPSDSYAHLSDKDLGSLIAFLKTLPPKENSFKPPTFTRFAKVLAGAGQFGELFPYNLIDHKNARNIPHPASPPDVEYGKYMSNIGGCVSCHKPDFGGGVSPDPVSPPVPNITKSANPGKWTKEQFVEVFRTGKTPEGKILNEKFMPFSGIGVFSDEEIISIYDYIMTLPGIEVKIDK